MTRPHANDAPVTSRSPEAEARAASADPSAAPAPGQPFDGGGPAAGDATRRSDNRRTGRPADWERPLLLALGGELAALRSQAGLTPLELGSRIGLSPESIRSVERGTIRTRPARIREWCQATGRDSFAPPLLAMYAKVVAADIEPARRWTPPVPKVAAPIDKATPATQTELGAVLARLREAAGLSRPELARAIGISRIAVFLLEHALRRPTSDTVERWGAAVNSPGLLAILQARFRGAIAPRRVSVAPPDQSDRHLTPKRTRERSLKP